MKDANLQAEAHWDQMEAAKRDGVAMAPHPLDIAAGARCIDSSKILSPALREAADRLLQDWADRTGVDRPGSEAPNE